MNPQLKVIEFPEDNSLYQIINSMEASLYLKDLEGRYVLCNDYMLNMAALSRKEIIGYTDYHMPWKNQANRIREIDALVVSQKKTLKVEETPTIAHNINKTFLSSKSPWLDHQGNIVGIIGVSIDITQNKLIESELHNAQKCLDQYVHIKDRFLQNISHEHRAPLCSMLSAVETLNDNWNKYDDKVKQQTLKLILEQSRRLSQLVINTLDISNFIHGTLNLELQKYNLTEVIQETIINYHNNYNTKLNIIFSPIGEYLLVFDKLQIEKVIINIIINAEKFTVENKSITINLQHTLINNSLIPAVQCCIQDNGIGIPSDELDSIFEPFSESSRTSTNSGGVGLGLALCKEIISAHAGEIWAENRLAGGCVFNFCIPTTLPCISKKPEEFSCNIINKDLNKIYLNTEKKPFALIGISPFNSYFSIEQILKIIHWVDNEYNDFSIFIPDQISKYTLEALGYSKQKIHHKIRKQDNYTENKVKKALDYFYQSRQLNKKIDIVNISELIDKYPYQEIYKQCIELFNKSKDFRNGCLDTTEWILSNKKSIDKRIDDFSKNIAVQYFLYELPLMINMPKVLGLKSSGTFVYHAIPDFIKKLYVSGFTPPTQHFW